MPQNKVCVGCNQTACRCSWKRQRPKRSYHGSVYRDLRETFLASFPICRDCGNEPATEVHHERRLAYSPETLLDTRTWAGLCKSCHSRRTARGE
jgi:5-methylcytosine-specific restriction protein A